MISGRARSPGVIERISASTFTSSRSSTCSASEPNIGSLATTSRSGPSFWIIWSCLSRSSRPKRPASRRSASCLRLGLVDDLLEIADQADHVAHPEDARRQALGPERLEPVERLAGADEADRDAGHGLDGERRAAARVAVELGQDQAVEREPLVERLRHLHGVAAHQRVAHQQRVGRRAQAVDLRELLHQLVVDREAAGRVVDDRVEALVAARAGRRPRRSAAGVSPGGAGVDGDLDPGAELLELEHGGGALHVGGHQQRAAPARGRGGARASRRPWSCRRPAARAAPRR